MTTTLVYTYNVDGLRIAQADVAYAGAQTYVWDWASAVPELLADWRYTYLIGLDTLGWEGARSPMSPVMWTYALPDALGSVRQETDAAGAVTAVREWSPYGEELGGAQAGLGYTGEWYDSYVNLQYLRARWLDVSTGRFTQQDPLKLEKNLYTYASANPILLIDPTGYFSNDTIASSFGKASFDGVMQMFLDDSTIDFIEYFGSYYEHSEDVLEGRWGFLKLLQDAQIGDDLYALEFKGFGKSELVHLGKLTGAGCSIWVGHMPLRNFVLSKSNLFTGNGITTWSPETYIGFHLNGVPYRDAIHPRLPDMLTSNFSLGSDFSPYPVGGGGSLAYTLDRYGNAYVTVGIFAQIGYGALPFDIGYTGGWVTGPDFYSTPGGGYAPTEAHLLEAIPGVSAGLNSIPVNEF
ncbi:MAG: RHS repeat-associated core domain-containing protein [Anaerolineae bacterium]